MGRLTTWYIDPVVWHDSPHGALIHWYGGTHHTVLSLDMGRLTARCTESVVWGDSPHSAMLSLTLCTESMMWGDSPHGTLTQWCGTTHHKEHSVHRLEFTCTGYMGSGVSTSIDMCVNRRKKSTCCPSPGLPSHSLAPQLKAEVNRRLRFKEAVTYRLRAS